MFQAWRSALQVDRQFGLLPASVDAENGRFFLVDHDAAGDVESILYVGPCADEPGRVQTFILDAVIG